MRHDFALLVEVTATVAKLVIQLDDCEIKTEVRDPPDCFEMASSSAGGGGSTVLGKSSHDQRDLAILSAVIKRACCEASGRRHSAVGAGREDEGGRNSRAEVPPSTVGIR